MIVAVPKDLEILYAIYCFQPLIQMAIVFLAITYVSWYLRVAIELISGQPISSLSTSITATTRRDAAAPHPHQRHRHRRAIGLDDVQPRDVIRAMWIPIRFIYLLGI